MKVLLVCLCALVSACTPKAPSDEECQVVHSWESYPLDVTVDVAEPRPVMMHDQTLHSLLAMAPPAARQYSHYCAAMRSDGRLVLTPNIWEPKEAYSFRHVNGSWRFESAEKIFTMQ